MSTLESKLDDLLAADFDVSISEVNATVEQWHDEHHFAIEKYETESIYGGYNVQRSAIPTEQDIEQMRERANAFLDRYSDAVAT